MASNLTPQPLQYTGGLTTSASCPPAPSYPDSQTTTTPTPSTAEGKPKYVPPMRRRMLLEQDRRAAALNNSGNVSAPPLAGSRDILSRSGGAFGHMSQPPAQPIVNDRWKALESTPTFHSRTFEGQSGDARFRNTVTGTYWDVRDGRRWRLENVRRLFCCFVLFPLCFFHSLGVATCCCFRLMKFFNRVKKKRQASTLIGTTPFLLKCPVVVAIRLSLLLRSAKHAAFTRCLLKILFAFSMKNQRLVYICFIYSQHLFTVLAPDFFRVCCLSL